MAIPSRAPQNRLDELFPLMKEAPPRGTFELGLMFGGTVSAGAYTAGAIDFLLEALEGWHGFNGNNPPHKLIVKGAVGTSGGAVCSALVGILSGHSVPHIIGSQDELNSNLNPTGNPLWDIWVNDFQLTRLLSVGDIESNVDADAGTGVTPGKVPAGDGIALQHVFSILNCQMIDEAAQSLEKFAVTATTVERSYFASPFRIAVTLANLRGIPFTVKGIQAYDGYTGSAFIEHDDMARFAFPNGAETKHKREDEFWLDPNGGGSGVVGYDVLASYAMASGSMPLGLVARTLKRPAEHYLYRPKVRVRLVGNKHEIEVRYPDPDWSELPNVEASGIYKFTAVDGGCFNNEPFGILHRDLAGLIGKNPRKPSEAHRAILMIDPLVDQPGHLKASGRSLVRVAESITGTLVGGAHYLTADLDLFRNEDVFSRFEMVPTRPEGERVGEAALAGTCFAALAGWAARPFRVHDFMLGRANMCVYLMSELVLTADNPLFDNWDEDLREKFATDKDGKRTWLTSSTPRSAYYLPILPVVKSRDVPMPDWPKGSLDPDSLHEPIVNRLEAVLKKLRLDNFPGILYEAGSLVAIPGVSLLIGSMLIARLKSELQKAGL